VLMSLKAFDSGANVELICFQLGSPEEVRASASQTCLSFVRILLDLNSCLIFVLSGASLNYYYLASETGRILNQQGF